MTYSRKRRGERTDPWGTPCVMIWGEDVDEGMSGKRELIRTTCVLCVRKEAIHIWAVPRMPWEKSFDRRRLWSIVSKALLRS